MKQALVTGDMGFVGGHIKRELRERGWGTTCIDIKRGQEVRDFFRHNDKFFDVVIHCAAIVGGRATIEGNPLHVASDLSIDAELFNWAMVTHPGRIIYFSSSAAYPVKWQTKTFHMDLYEDLIDLDDILSPDLTYGWAKLSGEMLARYAREAGVNVTVLRPFSGYGTTQDLDYPWPSFIQRARLREDPFTIWGDGTQVRDWVHIDDIVGTVLSCIDQGVDGPLNIGWGRPTSFLELAEMCCDAAGYHPKFDLKIDAPKGVHYRVCDPSKLNAVYQPKISLEQAVQGALHV